MKGDERYVPAGRGRASSWLAAAGLLVASAGLHLLAFRNLPLIPKNDSVWYLGLTHALAGERIFDLYALGEPTAFDVPYTIGYPLFLDLSLWLLGWEHLATGVLVLQHLAAIGSVLLVHRLGVELGRPGAGLLAACAYLLYFPALYYSHLMISETLFIFPALAAAVLFLRGVRTSRDGVLIASGALVGLATLVRPVALLEGAAFGVLLLLHGPPVPFAPRLRRLALFWAPPALLLALSLVHNQLTYGRATLSDAAGRHLIDRVWAFDRTVAADAPHTRRILAACRRSGEAFQIPGVWRKSYKALRSGSGLTAREADDLLRSAGLESVRAKPLGYLTKSGASLWHLFSRNDTWPPPLEQTLTPRAFERYLDLWTRPAADPRAVARSERAVEARRDFRRRVAPSSPEGSGPQRWWLVLWRNVSPRYGGATAVACLLSALALLRWGRKGDWIPVLAVVALALPPALVEYPFPRYRQPLTPFMLLIIASALGEAVRRFRESTLARRVLSAPRRSAAGRKGGAAGGVQTRGGSGGRRPTSSSPPVRARRSP